MKLKELVDCEYDTEVSSLAFDSRKCKPGSLFFCLEGGDFDGHDFCDEAIEKGAVAVVASRPVALKEKIPVVFVDDVRHSLAVASSLFFGKPSERMKMIAVTGTNGKTTTSYIIKSILEYCGKKVGMIGTNGIFFNDKRISPLLTTPDPIDLNCVLKEMADCGTEYVVMEVSAHALQLCKIDGLFFQVAAFTNLSEDHLDFFGNMEEYGHAKAKLFQPYYAANAVINVDDKFGQSLYKACALNTLSYGCFAPADVFAINLGMSIDGLEYVLNLMDEIADIKFCLPGRFNMYNTLCAAAVCHLLGISIDNIKNGIRSLKKVDGRFNIISTTKYNIIIDFAHTEDGLENILKAIGEFKKGRVITVFGCGGNRDKEKRAPMAKVATYLSDFTVITSDNPRDENPDDIINQAAKGAVNSNFAKIADRKAAIAFALDIGRKDDIILIAGKGAEKYQEIAGVKYEYNDEVYVKSLIEERGI